MRVSLFPIVDGACGCGVEGCKAVGKHPRPYATDEIPGAGHGIYTGGGLVVLDVDCKPGKPNGYQSLESAGVPLPDTYTVRTPTGGAHLYYTYPRDMTVGNRAGVFPGVDVRGEGGFVVGEGSPHVNGGTYQYVGGDMSPAPQWLLDAAIKTVDPSEVPTPMSPEHPQFQEHVRRCTEELRTYPPAIEGDCGGTQMFKAAQLAVRKYQLPLDLAERLLVEVYNPRCEPPWSGSELTQIGYKVRQAAEQGKLPIGTHDWLQNLIAREPTTVRKSPNPEHIYTFDIGTPPSPQRVPTCTSDVANTLLVDPDWEGVWQYDTFRNRVLAVDPPMKLDAETKGLTDSDGSKVLNWFEARGKKTSSAVCLASCDLAAHRNEFHPVKDYLESLRPATGALDLLAASGLGATRPLEGKFLRLALIAACRRILRPGCQVDDMLVLQGKQGKGKTTFCRILFGEWYRSQMPDLASKDASAALKGYWGVELAELDKVLRTETSTVKEFLSRTYDDYRPAYGRHEVHEARQCIFIGTTNEVEYLRDATGDRRYLPVAIGDINLSWLRDNRDAIWSEAYALAKTDCPHWLTDVDDLKQAEDLREVHKVLDPWEKEVLDYCKGKPWIKSTEDFAVERLGMKLADMTHKERLRIGNILTKAGCYRKNIRHEGKQQKVWVVSPELSGMEAIPTTGEVMMEAVRKLSSN